MKKHKCTKYHCDFCNKDVKCEWWHNTKYHNEPYAWTLQGEEYASAMKKHIGWLWEQILNSQKETTLANINDSYLGQFIKGNATR